MTVSQLKNLGIPTNIWCSLSENCSKILFSNEGCFYTQNTDQFYFEESSELVFVRNNRNGEPIRGGAIDKNIGIYHHVYDINELTAII